MLSCPLTLPPSLHTPLQQMDNDTIVCWMIWESLTHHTTPHFRDVIQHQYRVEMSDVLSFNPSLPPFDNVDLLNLLTTAGRFAITRGWTCHVDPCVGPYWFHAGDNVFQLPIPYHLSPLTSTPPQPIPRRHRLSQHSRGSATPTYAPLPCSPPVEIRSDALAPPTAAVELPIAPLPCFPPVEIRSDTLAPPTAAVELPITPTSCSPPVEIRSDALAPLTAAFELPFALSLCPYPQHHPNPTSIPPTSPGAPPPGHDPPTSPGAHPTGHDPPPSPGAPITGCSLHLVLTAPGASMTTHPPTSPGAPRSHHSLGRSPRSLGRSPRSLGPSPAPSPTSPVTTLPPTLGSWVPHPCPADLLSPDNDRHPSASSPTTVPTPIPRWGRSH